MNGILGDLSLRIKHFLIPAKLVDRLCNICLSDPEIEVQNKLYIEVLRMHCKSFQFFLDLVSNNFMFNQNCGEKHRNLWHRINML